MVGAGISAGGALRDALAFTHFAWRRAWGIQVLSAIGVALLFVSLRGRLSASQAWDMWSIGWAVTAVTAAPLAGTLLRLRLGGAAMKCMGPAGLQFGMTELRLLVIALAWAGATLLTILPLVAVSAFAFVVFRGFGMAELPLLGPVRVSFLLAALFFLSTLAVYGYGLARMSLALPATVGKRRLVLWEAWQLGRGYVGTLFWGQAISLTPSVLLFVAVIQLNALAVHDPTWGSLIAWPLPDAVMAGVVIGSVMSFIQAPLSLGVIAAVYCDQRQVRTEMTRQPVDTMVVRLASLRDPFARA